MLKDKVKTTAIIITAFMVLLVSVDLLKPKQELPTLEAAMKDMGYRPSDAKVEMAAPEFSILTRDPIQIPERVKRNLLSPRKSKISISGKLKLQGIIWSPTAQPKAVINSAILSEGDFIMGAQVYKIHKEKVILIYEGQELTLDLNK